jgi:hypothetical protein
MSLIRVSSLFLAGLGLMPAAEQVLGFRRLKVTESRQEALEPGAEVEFWLTRDGGASWETLPAAQIKRSDDQAPYVVFEAPADGRYGFTTRLLPTTGTSDPAPSPGRAPRIAFAIDTQPPELKALTAFLEVMDDDHYRLRCFWDVADAHLRADGQRLETSLDGIDWSRLAGDLPAAGAWSQLVPTRHVFVRLVATDAAGNEITSMVLRPAVLPEALTRSEPAKPTPPVLAVDQLPTLDEVAEEVEATMASVRAELRPEPAPTRPAASAPAPGPVSGPDPAVASATPAALESAKPVSPPPPSPEERLAQIHPLSKRPVQQPEPGDAERNVRVAAILERRQGRLLLGQDARLVLTGARLAVYQNDLTRAVRLYQRLHDSDQNAVALPEEVIVHYRAQRPIRARALAEQAPPEARSSRLSLALAYTWFTEDPRRCLAILDQINPDSPAAAEAEVLRARCLLLGDARQQELALALLRHRARDGGHWGQVAQEYLTIMAP